MPPVVAAPPPGSPEPVGGASSCHGVLLPGASCPLHDAHAMLTMDGAPTALSRACVGTTTTDLGAPASREAFGFFLSLAPAGSCAQTISIAVRDNGVLGEPSPCVGDDCTVDIGRLYRGPTPACVALGGRLCTGDPVVAAIDVRLETPSGCFVEPTAGRLCIESAGTVQSVSGSLEATFRGDDGSDVAVALTFDVDDAVGGHAVEVHPVIESCAPAAAEL